MNQTADKEQQIFENIKRIAREQIRNGHAIISLTIHDGKIVGGIFKPGDSQIKLG